MAHYYFVITAVPPLVLGVKPEITFKELRDLLALNLEPRDWEKFERLLRPIDLYNIRAFWLGLPFDDKGTLNARDLEESLLVKDHIPAFLVEFLDRYESTADRLRHFASLYASLYREEASGFLGKLSRLEREVRLVLTALRSKKGGRDLLRELQFEDPFDPFVAPILAQRDAPDYTPPREYEDLKTLFMENSSEPKKLAYALIGYRFKKIEEMMEGEYFTIDQVLGYAARLILVEEWEWLDWEKGRTAVEEITKYG